MLLQQNTGRHANNFGAMERETIKKNRVIPKNVRSRVNFGKIFMFLSLACFVFASCGGSKSGSSESASANSDFTKSFEGTISGKYEFIMTLTKNADKLSGTYRYKKGNGTSLKLDGTIDENGNLTLNEFNDKGSMTGVFKGQLSGANIVGNWTKPDGTGTMPFSVSETEKAETSVAGEEKAEDVKDWTGTYECETSNSSKTLVIKYNGGELQFQIIVASGECTGEVSGETALELFRDKVIATYGDESCSLHFTFYPKEISVSETDCDMMHGASCNFDGEYKFTSRKAKFFEY